MGPSKRYAFTMTKVSHFFVIFGGKGIDNEPL